MIQNVIVSTEAIFAIGNLLPRRRAIPALSNNTKSIDLPVSRSDKEWNTWYRYVHEMIQVLAIELFSTGSEWCPLCICWYTVLLIDTQKAGVG